jgi:hypothetical protein
MCAAQISSGLCPSRGQSDELCHSASAMLPRNSARPPRRGGRRNPTGMVCPSNGVAIRSPIDRRNIGSSAISQRVPLRAPARARRVPDARARASRQQSTRGGEGHGGAKRRPAGSITGAGAARSSGRHSKPPSKGTGEGAFRIIADLRRQLRQAYLGGGETMARELQAQFAQESKRREAGSLAEDPHQGRAGDPGFRGKRVERPGPGRRHQHGCYGTGRRRRGQNLHEIIGTCRLIEMTPEHHDERALARSSATAVAPGRPASSSSSMACTSMRIRWNGSLPGPGGARSPRAARQ